jgi:hypothetical protein
MEDASVLSTSFAVLMISPVVIAPAVKFPMALVVFIPLSCVAFNLIIRQQHDYFNKSYRKGKCYNCEIVTKVMKAAKNIHYIIAWSETTKQSIWVLWLASLRS